MTRERRVLRGIAASPGVAVGEAMVLDARHVHVPHRHVDDDEVGHQIERLSTAIERSRRELEAIQERLGQDAAADYRLILESHLMMHRDELLIDRATEAIREELVSAEWAVEKAVGSITKHLAAADDAYFRDRAVDVEHVGKRIIAQLVGRGSSLPPLLQDAVLVVEDLHPADAAQLIETPVRALVTGYGSATSHTAILARTLEIPAVVGVSGVLDKVGNGDTLIVDALRSCLVLEPDAEEQARAEERATRYIGFTRRLREQAVGRSETLDGVRIELLANVDLPAEAALAATEKTAGVGLYRTEFLFIGKPTPPSEEEQYRVYADIVKVMDPRPVTLRTVDMGGDALSIAAERPLDPNPALGLRATRLALTRPDLFRDQLRACLRAALHGTVRIMFPLISGPAELRSARAELDQARNELDRRGVNYGRPEVGVMIELPAAVLMADQLARECDFFSVGTNDLMQYTMAVDRSNPQVAYLADSLDPAVLRQLDSLMKSARGADQPLSMCGDMASDPMALPVVLGLGYRSLSMPLASIPLVRAVLRQVDVGQARLVAQQALDCASAAEVRALVHERFERPLGEVWREAGVEPNSSPPPAGA